MPMKGPAIHSEAVRCLLGAAAAGGKLLIDEVPDSLAHRAASARQHRIQIAFDMPSHNGIGAGQGCVEIATRE